MNRFVSLIFIEMVNIDIWKSKQLMMTFIDNHYLTIYLHFLEKRVIALNSYSNNVTQGLYEFILIERKCVPFRSV